MWVGGDEAGNAAWGEFMVKLRHLSSFTRTMGSDGIVLFRVLYDQISFAKVPFGVKNELGVRGSRDWREDWF